MSIDSRLTDAARLLSGFGFRLESDRKRPGLSRLLVAIRSVPTLRHFDPEMVIYWESDAEGRGHRTALDTGSEMPLHARFAWGSIELLDRFGVRNDFVTLGGDLFADRTDPSTITTILSSPGPILSLGGHSQRTDRVGLEIGAFFGRMMVPIDFMPGIEQAISAATPLARYAAFVQYERKRFDLHRTLRVEQPDYAALTAAEARRLESSAPMEWRSGCRLLERMQLAA